MKTIPKPMDKREIRMETNDELYSFFSPNGNEYAFTTVRKIYFLDSSYKEDRKKITTLLSKKRIGKKNNYTVIQKIGAFSLVIVGALGITTLVMHMVGKGKRSSTVGVSPKSVRRRRSRA